MSIKQKEIRICDYCGKAIKDSSIKCIEGEKGQSTIFSCNAIRKTAYAIQDADFCNVRCFVENLCKKLNHPMPIIEFQRLDNNFMLKKTVKK